MCNARLHGGRPIAASRFAHYSQCHYIDQLASVHEGVLAMKIRSVRSGLAGVCAVSLALASGCTSNEDRSRTEKASQENFSLKTQVTEMTAEHETLQKDLASA